MENENLNPQEDNLNANQMRLVCPLCWMGNALGTRGEQTCLCPDCNKDFKVDWEGAGETQELRVGDVTTKVTAGPVSYL